MFDVFWIVLFLHRKVNEWFEIMSAITWGKAYSFQYNCTIGTGLTLGYPQAATGLFCFQTKGHLYECMHILQPNGYCGLSEHLLSTSILRRQEEQMMWLTYITTDVFFHFWETLFWKLCPSLNEKRCGRNVQGHFIFQRKEVKRNVS